MGTVHWRKTDARYKKGFPMTVAVPTITDVVFDFCGVLLDWRTRACLEGRFDDATVDRICADDDPCGFFGYEDRMDAGEDFDSIWPDVVAEQGERVAGIFRYYIAHYDDALPRMLPGMERLLRDLKAAGYGVWGLTNWSHETFHFAFEKFPQLAELLQGTVVSGVEKMHKPNADIYELAMSRFDLSPERVPRRHREERRRGAVGRHARLPFRRRRPGAQGPGILGRARVSAADVRLRPAERASAMRPYHRPL